MVAVVAVQEPIDCSDCSDCSGCSAGAQWLQLLQWLQCRDPVAAVQESWQLQLEHQCSQSEVEGGFAAVVGQRGAVGRSELRRAEWKHFHNLCLLGDCMEKVISIYIFMNKKKSKLKVNFPIKNIHI